MKWNYVEHNDGDIRIIKRFLLFPKCIKGECRWLCVASIKQKYNGRNYADNGWKNISFID